MPQSLKLVFRLLASIFLIIIILIFFQSIAISTTLLIIISTGMLVFFIGINSSKYTKDLETSMQLALLIPLIVFLLWFFYILAQVTLLLYLVTVISFIIVQDWVYRVIFYLQEGNKLIVREDWKEAIWYSIGILSILITAFSNFDTQNYSDLSNASVLNYLSTDIKSQEITLESLASVDSYLHNSWLNLKGFASDSTIGIVQGLLKITTVLFIGYITITSILRYLSTRHF